MLRRILSSGLLVAFGLLSSPASAAGQMTFLGLGAKTTVGDDYSLNWGIVKLTFKNNTGSAAAPSATVVTCGPYDQYVNHYDEDGNYAGYWDDYCGTAGGSTLSPGATGTLDLWVPLFAPYYDGIIKLRFAADSALVRVVVASDGYTYSATLVPFPENTYTPWITHGTSIAVAANGRRSQSYNWGNNGNTPATYTLAVSCTGTLTGCTIGGATSSTTAAMASGGWNTVSVGFNAGAVTTTGASGQIRVVVTAPPRASGRVDADTSWLTVNAADLDVPTIAISPAGAPDPSQPGEQLAYGISSHGTPVTVDVCDDDGTVGIPALTLNGATIAATEVVPASVAGCNTARHATYAVPLQPGWNNLVSVSVSDGIHATTARQWYSYDDTPDHVPVLHVVRSAVQAQAYTTVTDTVLVTNPGWRTAQYSVGAGCTTSTWSSCNATRSPASLTIGPGATVPLQVTYTMAEPHAVTNFMASVVYAGAFYSSVTPAAINTTSAATLPPQIIVTPAGGSVVTTSRINVVVSWCDPDDSFAQWSVVWQGQTLANTAVGETRAGCFAAGRSTYNNLVINPWVQPLVATMVDVAGHATTVTANITYAPPLSTYQPHVTPASGSHSVPANAIARDTFTVGNPGIYAATYALTASCGSLGNCAISKGATTLNPGDTDVVVVSYTSPGYTAGHDTVRAIARYTSPLGSAIADTGKKRVVVPLVEVAPVVAVTPLITALDTTWVSLVWYTVKNNGSEPVTYNLSTTSTPGFGFPNWFIPPRTLTVDPGQTGEVSIYTKAPVTEGLTGLYTLTASYSSVAGPTLNASATATVVTTVPRRAIAVGPKSSVQIMSATGGLHAVGFTVVASGNTDVTDAHVTITCGALADPACLRDPYGLLNNTVSAVRQQPATVVVDFNLMAGHDTGWIKLVVDAVATSNSPALHDSATIVIRTNTPYVAVAVTPKTTLTVNPNHPLIQTFYITNTGNIASAFAYVRACSGVLTACSVLSGTTAVLAPGQREAVTLSGQVGSASGAMTVVATALPPWSSADTGKVLVSTGAVADLILDSRHANPGASVTRSACLTIGAGDGAAFECGDLRLVHALSTTTTMNRPHTPALIYSSAHAIPTVTVAADVTLQPGSYPTRLHATLSLIRATDTVVVARDIPWQTAWSDGRARRIGVSFDAASRSVSTGAYRYQLAVQPADSLGTSFLPATDTGTVVVVDRGSSPFGRGWWLDGLEQLVAVPDTGRMLWIGGDGSTRLYKRVTAQKWVASPIVDRPDTLESVTGGYIRWLADSAHVRFDGFLRHTATINRKRDSTSFQYDGSGRVATIGLPVPAGAVRPTYTFSYTTSFGSSTILSSVIAPAIGGTPRITSLGYVTQTNLVNGITDPDTSLVGFTNDVTTHRVLARADRNAAVTTYAYDEIGKLRQVSLDLTPSGEAVVTSTLCAAESRGVATCPLRVDSLAVYTLLDGPRTDVGDTTRFYLNNFGQPDAIVDALGHRTSIVRDEQFPMLAAQLSQPSGHTTRATYNARGLVATETDVAPYGAGDATTRYVWNANWMALDTIVAPTGETTRFGYLTNGERQWQEDGRGPLSRTWFTYGADRQLNTLQPAGNSTAQVQRIEYDAAFGNVLRVTSPLGIVTTYHRDAIGRVDTITSPIDATHSRQQTFVYDLADRVKEQRDIGPAIPYAIDGAAGTAPAVTLLVQNVYDRNGNLVANSRSSIPNLADLGGTITLHWTYDGAGRRLTATDSHGQVERWTYDAAGNATTWNTRRQGVVATVFDALNRPTRRTIYGMERSATVGNVPADYWWVIAPKFPYFGAGGYMFDPIAHPTLWPPSLMIATDVATFTYDDDGNLKTAINNDASISRDYFANGALKTDILKVAVYDTLETPVFDRFGSHVYRLDYTYDASGRRLTRTDSIPGCVSCVQLYHYDPAWGALDYTVDGGATFAFAYDSAARVRGRTTNGTAVSATFSYDADGKLVHRNLRASGSTPTVYDDALTYDVGGRIVETTILSDFRGIADHTVQAYSGLGALAAIRRQRGGASPIDEYMADAFGNTVLHNRWSGDVRTAFGNQYGLGRLGSTGQSAPAWSSGDPAPQVQTIDSTFQMYDASGNVESTGHSLFQWQTNGAWAWSQTGPEWTWNVYAADEKLRISQHSYRDVSGLRTSFSEYKYDALGRRILTRTRWDQYCVPTRDQCLSTIDRTVWDGDQILYESRTNAPYNLHGAALEQESTYGSFTGSVRYTHAGGIDEPLAIWKNSFGIVPHRSWRGLYEAGSYVDGSATTGINWPARDRDAFFAKDARVTALQATDWLGSLVEGKADPSGLMYMRNRYYDPQTGRFTQEDPIGLAGGINLYGFAGGDPVNYRDPFGLCKDKSGNPISPAACDKPIERVSVDVRIADALLWVADVGLAAGDALLHGAERAGIEYARRRAVKEAWRLEGDLVRRTGEGTRAWTEAEAAELLEAGKVSGYQGHHINSVNGHPELARDASNIRFVRAGAEHLEQHSGNYRNPTQGPLMKRDP